MPVAYDESPTLLDYADPHRLVTTDWLAEHLHDDALVVLESNEDVLLYETGHIPGARKIDWHTDLNDSVMRDYVSSEDFAALMSRLGVHREDTVVIYGDRSNWWAAYAMWVLKLFGHEDVRLLNGGRDKWRAEGRELTREVPAVTPSEYPVVVRDETDLRARRDDVLAQLQQGKPLIDVRSLPEYTGERTHMPDYPQEGALRTGHVPTARSVPWARAANEDGTFKSRAELEQIYHTELGLNSTDEIVAYCRIGERSSHTWFVLKYLLGFPRVRNYDGSWTEWGSLVGVPIVQGEAPGEAPKLGGRA